MALTKLIENIFCLLSSYHMIILISQTVVTVMHSHSLSLPLCFVIYSIHVLDCKQPDAVHELLGLILKYY